MHAWWIRAFSSAYGSTSRRVVRLSQGDDRSAREWWRCCLPLAGRDDRGVPLSAQLLDRLRPRRLAVRLCSAAAGCDFASARIAFEKSAPGSARTAASPRLTESGTDAVGRELVGDLDLQRRLDLALRQADLRVGPVQHEADAVRREREQLEGLQREPDVLQRRNVEPAEHEQLVGAVERREHRPVEERRRVDDDHVVALAGHLEQARDLRLGDELGVLGAQAARGGCRARTGASSCSPASFSKSSSPGATTRS